MRRLPPPAGLLFACLAAAFALRAAPLPAASGTWSGAVDSQWSLGDNWSASPAPGPGNTATFSGAGNGRTTLDLGGGVSVGAILFDTAGAAAYTIGSGGAGAQGLTLDPGGSVTLAAAVTTDQRIDAAVTLGPDADTQSFSFTQNRAASDLNALTFAGGITGGSGGAAGTKTLTVAGSGNTVISGPLANGGAAFLNLTKSGAGTLTLANPGNSFTAALPSGLSLAGGFLSVPADGCLGDPTNVVSLNGGGLRASGTYATARQINTTGAGTLDVTAGNVLTLTSPFNGGAASGSALSKSGSGVLELAADNSGATPYTGVITINAGAVRVSDAGALGAPANATVVANAAGAALQLDNVTIAEALTLNNSGIRYGGALQAVAGTSAVSAAIALGSAAVIGADAGTALAIRGGITGASALTFNPAAGATITIATTPLNAPTPLNQYGAGTLAITTAGATTQPLNVYDGTLAVAEEGQLGGSGLVTLYGDSAVNLAGTAANRLGGRALTMYGGSLNLDGAADEAAGALTVNTGPAVIHNASGSTLTLASIARGAGGTALFRGGSPIVNSTAPTYIGQGGATGSLNKGIYPWALFDAGAGAGTGFATMNSSAPYALRALDAASEMSTNAFTANANVRLTATPAPISAATSVNSLTLESAGAGVEVGPGHTLTLLSGGVLNLAGGAGINGGYLSAGSGELVVHAAGDLTIGSTVAGSGGLTKAGAGTLTLAGGASFSGSLTLNGGSLAFSGPNPAYGFLATTGPSLYLNSGATLDLGAGRSLVTGTLYSNGNVWQAAGSGGTVTGAGGTLSTRGMTQGQTFFSGDVGGSLSWNIAGQTRGDDLVLLGPITTSGNLKIQCGYSQVDNSVRGLTLRDGAVLANVGSITINGTAGGLAIDNSADSTEHSNQAGGSIQYLADRVRDAAPITLNGGAIAFYGRPQTDSAETLGAVTLGSGNSFLASVAGQPGSAAAAGSATLTLTSLTRGSYASLNVVDRVRTDVSANTLGQPGNYGRILVTGALSGNLAAVNGVVPGVFSSPHTAWHDLVSYVPGRGFGPFGRPGFPAYYSPGGNNFSGAGPASNVKGSGTVPSGGLTINSLTQGAVTFAGGTPSGGDRLTVNSGMVIVDGSVGSLGSASARGRITSGRRELFLVSRDGVGSRCAVNSVLTDNGAPVAVIVTGAHRSDVLNTNTGDPNSFNSYPSFTAANEHTGGTFVNKGGLILAGTPGSYTVPPAADPLQGLVVNGAMLWLQTPGQIHPRNVLTLSGNSVLWVQGTHTLGGLILNHDSGRGWWYESIGVSPTGPATLILNGDLTANFSVPGTRGAVWSSPSSTPNQLDFGGAVRNVTVNIPASLQTGDRTPTYPQLYHDHQNTMLNAGAVKLGKGLWCFGYYPRFDYGLQINDGAVACQWIYGPVTIRNNAELRFSSDNFTPANCAGITIEATGGTFGLMGGTRTMSTPLALGGPLTIRLDDFDVPGTDRSLTLNSPVSGTGSVVVRGNAANYASGSAWVQLGNYAYTHTGGWTIEAGGQVRLGGADYCLAAPTAPMTVNAAGALHLNGRTARAGKFSGTGGKVTGSGTLIIGYGDSSADGTYAGVVESAAAITKVGAGTLTLAGNNTSTGATTVNEGTLVLRGSPTGNSAVTVNGGTLKLDYSANDTGKIHDSAGLTLSGGTLELAAGTHTEVVGSLTLGKGASRVTRTSGAGVLRLNAITRGAGNLGTINFSAANIASTSTGNDASGILGSWATVGGTDWAANSGVLEGPGNYYIAPLDSASYHDIAAMGDTVPDQSGWNVRINSAGTSGSDALAAAVTTVNTLLQNTGTACTVDTAGKALRATGIMIGSGQEALTIGAAPGDGSLSAVTSGGDLVLNNNSGAKLLTVNARVVANGASTLTSSGNVRLAGVNAYTGGTTIGAGTLEIGGAGQLGSGTYSGTISIGAGGTFLYNSSANQVVQTGGISGLGGLYKDNTGTLTLNVGNTYLGGAVVNGGTLVHGVGGALCGAVTINAGGVVATSNVGYYSNNATTAPQTLTLNGGEFRLTYSGIGNSDFYVKSVDLTGGSITATGATRGFYSWFNTYGATLPFRTHASSATATISAPMASRSVSLMSFDTELGSTPDGVDLLVSGPLFWETRNGVNYGVTKTGPGTLAITGINDLTSPGHGYIFNTGGGNQQGEGYSLATTITGGTLQLGNNGTTGSLNPNSPIVNNATLAFHRTDALTQGTHFNSVISGTGGVTQRGSGTAYLSGANTYSGVTTVSAGTLNAGWLANYGSSSPIGTGAGTANAAALVLSGGTLQYTGAGAQSSDRLFTIGAGGATLDASGGALTLGSAGGAVGFSGADSPASLTLTGSGAGVLAASLNNPASSTASLTKNGTGTWTLTAANAFSDRTTVSGGKLYLNAANNSTAAIAVGEGATLGGSGSAASASALVQGTVEAGCGGSGSLGLAGLALAHGSTVRATDIGNYASTPAINVTGLNALIAAGIVTVKLTGDAPVGNGRAHLIKYAGTIGGAGFAAFNTTPDISEMVGAGGSATFQLVNNTAQKYIDVVYSSDRPVWKGAGPGTWITGGPDNGDWRLASAPGTLTHFIAGDAPLFDDTASGVTTVEIGAADVVPASVVVSNNVKPYAFQGVFGIGGSGPMIKRGSGLLTLACTNTFSGQLTVEDGTLRVGAVNDAGAGGPLGNSTQAVVMGKAGSAGALEYTGATASSTKPFTMAAGGTGAFDVTNATAALTLSGAVGGAGTLLKSGAGTLILSGTNNCGKVRAGEGTLQFARKASLFGGAAGSWTPANITVDSGATLALSVESGATGQFGAADVATLLDSAHLGASTAAAGLTSGSTLAFDTGSSAGAVTIGTAIANPNGGANAVGLTKSGTGTLALTTAANTYTGPTAVNGGTLQPALGTSLGGTASRNASLTINAGATCQFTGQQMMYNANRGPVTINGGTLDSSYVTGGNKDASFTAVTMAGGLWSNSGTGYFDIFNNGLDSTANPLPVTTLASAATAQITASRINTRNGIHMLFTVADGAADPDLLVTGVLSPNGGTGTVTKDGRGVMALKGVSTYATTYSANGGTLLLDLSGAVSTNILATSSILRLAGGTFRMKGRAEGVASQTVASLTAAAGTSRLALDPNGGTLTTLQITSATLTTAAGSMVTIDYTAGTTVGETPGNNYVKVPASLAGMLPLNYRVQDSGGTGYAKVLADGTVVRSLTALPDLPQSGAVAGQSYTVTKDAGDADGSLDMIQDATQAADFVDVDTAAKADGVLDMSAYALSLNTLNVSGPNPLTVAASAGGGLKAASAGGVLTLANNAGGAVTVSAPVADNGTSQLVVAGRGLTVLGGASDYRGLTTISAGATVKLGAAGSGANTPLGTTANETQLAGVLDLNGFSLATAETLRIRVGATVINSAPAAAYYPGTIGAFGESGTTRNIIADAGAIRIAYVNFGGYDPFDWSFTLGGSGTGDNRIDAIFLDRGNTVYKTGSGTWTIGSLRDQATGYGAAGITVNGGTLISAGNDANANFYGPVTLNAGTLKLGATGIASGSGPLGRSANGTTVTGTGAALDVNGYSLAYAEPLTLNGSGIANGGALRNGASAAASWPGPITVNSATRIACAQSGATLTLGSVVSAGANAMAFGGAGTVVVGGTLTCSGGLTAEEGTLQINGAATGGGPVRIKSGATLGGSGAVSGVTTVEGGAHLAPGSAGAGTLTLSAAGASLILEDGVVLDVQLGGSNGAPTCDRIDLTGAGSTVQFGQHAELRVSLAPDATVDPAEKTFVLIDYNGADPTPPEWSIRYSNLRVLGGRVVVDTANKRIVLTEMVAAPSMILIVR